MAKLYFNGSKLNRHQTLSKELLDVVEQGIAQTEKQGIFRALYDIEIVGVTVYYRKNWRYDKLSREEDQKEVEGVVVGA